MSPGATDGVGAAATTGAGAGVGRTGASGAGGVGAGSGAAATGSTVIKNVTLPTRDGSTQIDHIIVSEFGVFVVETKNMKGRGYLAIRIKSFGFKKYMNILKPFRIHYTKTTSI